MIRIQFGVPGVDWGNTQVARTIGNPQAMKLFTNLTTGFTVPCFSINKEKEVLLYVQVPNGKRKKTHTCIVAYFSGDKFSTDWDKAWSSFRKQGKKRLFSQFSPDKYVTWNPRRSNYPLSEEVDPIKRTERSNLMLWTSPGFTLTVAIIIVTFLLIYTILAPVK
ncbi:hypothetical protein CK203_024073 [Vitis vinifera]|uniref:Uncharacterized protein n=1 Tax=Vitis vinifera TaxID=29760 RepID=A0A438IPU7_VITVI|nr:hypothetical protein CK203_024073 [Vitis vinifera]